MGSIWVLAGNEQHLNRHRTSALALALAAVRPRGSSGDFRARDGELQRLGMIAVQGVSVPGYAQSNIHLSALHQPELGYMQWIRCLFSCLDRGALIGAHLVVLEVNGLR